jgi:hypothetical protein
MKLSIKSNSSDLVINFKDKDFHLKYPEKIWENLPENIKKIFVDNYLFLKSVHIPIILNADKVILNTSSPLLKSFFLNMQFMDIPSFSFSDKVLPNEYFKRFFNTTYKFKDNNVKYPTRNFSLNENSSVVSFTFGKDSLLTLAILKELDFENHPVWVEEEGSPIENKFKRRLIKKFKEQFDIKIERIYNETVLLHSYHYLGISKERQYSLSHLLTEYAFLMIPYLYNYRSKYVFFGNEQSCNISFISDSGFKCYPVYDQSVEWMTEINKMMNIFLKNKFYVSSIVEPLHDLAIVRILYRRYPELAKYQYSCFPDETMINNFKRWCCHCSKCARLYIIFKALNINTKKVGFKNGMLTRNHKSYYSIFGVNVNDCDYDVSGVGRDEQLLAFYLAHKNKVKGELIDEFKKTFLDEAKEREDELYKKFFSVHKSLTLPKKIKRKIISIFKEELN